MVEEVKEENTFVPGSSLEKPSVFKSGHNDHIEEIEDPEELERMEEMWSKMFQRILAEGELLLDCIFYNRHIH